MHKKIIIAGVAVLLFIALIIFYLSRSSDVSPASVASPAAKPSAQAENIKRACLHGSADAAASVNCTCMAEEILADPDITAQDRKNLETKFEAPNITQDMINNPNQNGAAAKYDAAFFRITDECYNKLVDAGLAKPIAIHETGPQSPLSANQGQPVAAPPVASGPIRTVSFAVNNDSKTKKVVDIQVTIDGKEEFNKDVAAGAEQDFKLDLRVGQHVVSVKSVKGGQQFSGHVLNVTDMTNPASSVAYFDSNFSFSMQTK